MGTQYTEEQAREMLRRQCKDAGGQKAWADLHNVSTGYVCDALSGNRGLGRVIAEALGLQRATYYEPQKMATRERTEGDY